jgi:hypothetical protein
MRLYMHLHGWAFYMPMDLPIEMDLTQCELFVC